MRKKYRIGDVIRVRGDLVPGERYGGVTMSPGQKSEETIGQEGRITRIDVSEGRCYYSAVFGRDPIPWTISEEMIEGRAS